MTIIVEFTGGFLDGRTSRSDEGNLSEPFHASGVYAMTKDGALGAAFQTVSEAGLKTMREVGANCESPEDMSRLLAERGVTMNHRYKVVGRREEGGDIYLRLQYLPPKPQ